MVYQLRTRKRVNALRRAPDGSAFQFCESCGVSVAVALLVMHDCEIKKEVKKSKVENRGNQFGEDERFPDQPRSEFRFFMESFVKNCDSKSAIEIEQNGFRIWQNMLSLERLPYELQARKVNDAYFQKLLKESEDQMCPFVDEEADSAEVGKFDETSQFFDDDSYDSDCFDSD